MVRLTAIYRDLPIVPSIVCLSNQIRQNSYQYRSWLALADHTRAQNINSSVLSKTLLCITIQGASAASQPEF